MINHTSDKDDNLFFDWNVPHLALQSGYLTYVEINQWW